MIIKGGTVCDARGEKKADVRVENGCITRIAAQISPKKGEEVIDANGKYILPGAIDLNASLGQNTGNIFKTLAKVESDALKGGVTTIALQPATPINTEIGLDYLVSKSKELSLTKLAPIVSALENNDTDKLNNMAIMFKNGAFGTFIDSDSDANSLRRTMEYSAMSGKPMFVRLASKKLDGEGVMHDSPLAFELGLGVFQSATEPCELVKICEMTRAYGSKTVINSLSLARSAEIAAQSKKQAEGVYFCADIHHLVLTDNECAGYDTYAKNYPPLRDEEARSAMIKAIKNGSAHCVSSGHTPVRAGQKDVAFEDAAFGIESLALFLPLCFTYTVKSGALSLSKLSSLVSYAPANILGLDDVGLIKVGYKADIVLFDANMATDKSAFSKYDSYANGPYMDKELFGSVTCVLKDGVRVL
jgi:dihydroorotase